MKNVKWIVVVISLSKVLRKLCLDKKEQQKIEYIVLTVKIQQNGNILLKLNRFLILNAFRRNKLK